jgi:hypothetical protein
MPALTLAALQTEVLQRLQKTPGYQGFYTADKVLSALQESCDYVTAKMMEAASGEWRDEDRYYTTTAGDTLIAIDADVCMIKQVRYLIGNVYVPLAYDEMKDAVMYAPAAGMTAYPSRYAIREDKTKGSCIFFNPAISMGGTDYLQITLCAFPTLFSALSDNIPSAFNRAFQHYVVYRSCNILGSDVGKFNKEWAQQYGEWFDVMLRMVDKRVNSTSYVREFNG